MRASDPSPPLIAHAIYRLDIGGLENGLVNLINRFPSDRYRHCVICMEDFSEFRQRITRSDVRVFAMRKSQTGAAALYRHLYSLFRKLRPTIVHSRNLSGLDTLLPAMLAGVPHRVHSEHGRDVDDLDGTSLKPRLLRKLHGPLIQRYIAVSKDLQNYLIRGIGVSSSRITQIYNGVDTERFAPVKAKPARVLPESFYGDDKVVIGTVGRLQPIKDQVTLVRAFAHALEQQPSLRAFARLAIVGSGPSHDALLACVREQCLSDLVWMPGARDDVAQVLQCLDVFVLPSLNEGISNTILEAMASGLPIVATAVGGNLELVVEGVNGRLVPSRDPAALGQELTRYLLEPELRRRHANASRKRATDHFSIEAMVNAYLRFYDSLYSDEPTAATSR